MSLWAEYHTPTTVDGALEILLHADGVARLIAGGTDLLLDMQQGREAPAHTLVDVTQIEEMKRISIEADSIFVGGAVTHAEIVRSPVLQANAACLVQASGLIGGPQVRTVATLGGNVAHGLPAGDGSIALLALEAEVGITATGGRRWVPVESFFRGPGAVILDREREILVGFRVPVAGKQEASAFQRVMRPQGVAIAIQNMAVWVRWGPGGVIDDIRLAVGAAGPRPIRARRAEAMLSGRTWDAQVGREASEALLQEASLRTSPHRATAEYRRMLVGVLLQRVIEAALAAAPGPALVVSNG